MRENASQHGSDLFFDGFTVSQVVHDYGAVCQSVTDLAVELDTAISVDDFRTLNRCLDDSIAGAVSAHGRQKNNGRFSDREMALRNMISTALPGFEVLQSGTVGIEGATGRLVHRCLVAMRDLTSISH
jgi:hypothetical protein